MLLISTAVTQQDEENCDIVVTLLHDSAVVLLLLWAGLVIAVAQTLSKLSELLPGDWGTLCFASDK